MRVLIVGGGGREHAIAWKLRQSSRLKELYCAPGNAGIAQLASIVPLKDSDIDGITSFAVEKRIDLVVVGPEAPLAAGLVDELQKRGVAAFGPSRQAAMIESSKSFAKRIMSRAGIATADAERFADVGDALEFLNRKSLPVVIKADGLAAGKGVVVAETREEAERAIRSMLQERIHGSAGSRILIEDYLQGKEVSVLGITDGKRIRVLAPARDHKRVFDHDRGPNTGGMGAFSPVPGLPDGFAEQVRRTVLQPAVDALAEEGSPFRGVLYAGLMLTEEGPKVLEFNARFGDPETQVILPLLQEDLLDLMQSAAEGNLAERNQPGGENSRAAVSVVLASGGYPGSYLTGLPISGLGELEQQDDIVVFHAGTKLHDGGFVTAGGRVLNVVAWDSDLAAARDKVYQAVQQIHFKGAHYRTDIAQFV